MENYFGMFDFNLKNNGIVSKLTWFELDNVPLSVKKRITGESDSETNSIPYVFPLSIGIHYI